MRDTLSTSLAAVVRSRREAEGLSTSALAERSGVSRAMIAKVERGEAQPTAALLARLAGALGLTLSALVAHAEQPPRRVARRAEQPVWTDPASGYLRRAVSPASTSPLELVEVTLPPGAELPFAADTYRIIHQQMWVLEGRLRFHEGPEIHELEAGDCLELGPPQDCVFVNPTAAPCRYLVALSRRFG